MMLMLIKDRLNDDNAECDEAMLHAWSLLWNVTGRSTTFADHVSASFSLQSFHVYDLIFTARRSYASAVLGVVILSVRPSFCLSVTRVLCD